MERAQHAENIFIDSIICLNMVEYNKIYLRHGMKGLQTALKIDKKVLEQEREVLIANYGALFGEFPNKSFEEHVDFYANLKIDSQKESKLTRCVSACKRYKNFRDQIYAGDLLSRSKDGLVDLHLTEISLAEIQEQIKDGNASHDDFVDLTKENITLVTISDKAVMQIIKKTARKLAYANSSNQRAFMEIYQAIEANICGYILVTAKENAYIIEPLEFRPNDSKRQQIEEVCQRDNLTKALPYTLREYFDPSFEHEKIEEYEEVYVVELNKKVRNTDFKTEKRIKHAPILEKILEKVWYEDKDDEKSSAASAIALTQKKENAKKEKQTKEQEQWPDRYYQEQQEILEEIEQKKKEKEQEEFERKLANRKKQQQENEREPEL